MGEYAWKLSIGRLISSFGRYVKLVFPENISTNEESKKLQEAFEQILIDYGLLKAGIEAVGDELGRSTREDAAATADTIRRSKNE